MRYSKEIAEHHAGFHWVGWIKPNDAKPTSFHVEGFNFDGSGFTEYDLDERGVKIECTHDHAYNHPVIR